MKLFLSGWQATRRDRELAVIKSGGLKHRMFSFCSVYRVPGLPYFLPHVGGSYDECVKNGVGIALDSGVVGYRSYAAKMAKLGKKTKLPDAETFIKLYIDYVRANKKDWDFAIGVDMKRDAPSIFEHYMQIQKQAPDLDLIPVFHGDASTDWIKKYADKGKKLISLASWHTLRSNARQKKQYLDTCFNLAVKLGIQYHGLGMTSSWQMISYPWYSTDSSSWSRCAGYGTIFRFDEHSRRLSMIHVSTRESKERSALKLNSRTMAAVKEWVRHEGYDFDQLREDMVLRHIFNAKEMNRMTEYATKIHGQTTEGWNLLFQ